MIAIVCNHVAEGAAIWMVQRHRPVAGSHSDEPLPEHFQALCEPCADKPESEWTVDDADVIPPERLRGQLLALLLDLAGVQP